MAATSIQWTDHSVNPIRFGRGHYCQKISPGCTHCYASRSQPRWGNPQFSGTGSPLPMVVNEESPRDGALSFHESKLREVLRRRKPTRYFWCDMTDLFGAWVPDEWIDRCFATMALTPQHTHQVLTKRAERMAKHCADEYGAWPGRVFPHWAKLAVETWGTGFKSPQPLNFPLPNVWLGVSVEDQQRADERIPHLLRTLAAVRFLSVEPLLGPVDLTLQTGDGSTRNALTGQFHGIKCKGVNGNPDFTVETVDEKLPRIAWVIVGGESGPGARPMQVEWARSIVEQCKAAGVACFVKQLGSLPAARNDEVADWFDECPHLQQQPTASYQGAVGRIFGFRDRKGGDPAEWPSDLRVREFPLCSQ